MAHIQFHWQIGLVEVPKQEKIYGRTIAIGFCPRCSGPNVKAQKRRSVVIEQDAIEWADDTETVPTAWGPPRMACACGATIHDVEFPLGSGWQMLLTSERERSPKPARGRAAKVVPIQTSRSKQREEKKHVTSQS